MQVTLSSPVNEQADMQVVNSNIICAVDPGHSDSVLKCGLDCLVARPLDHQIPWAKPNIADICASSLHDLPHIG